MRCNTSMVSDYHLAGVQYSTVQYSTVQYSTVQYRMYGEVCTESQAANVARRNAPCAFIACPPPAMRPKGCMQS